MWLLQSVMLCAFRELDCRRLTGQSHRSYSWDLRVLARYAVPSTSGEKPDLWTQQTELCKTLAAFLFNDEQRGL